MGGKAVLVVGAELPVVSAALDEAGPDGAVVVVDASVARLEQLEATVRDGRLWYLIGDADVIPLPDGSVDSALGAQPSAELDRVLR